jgi:hypothetical protein
MNTSVALSENAQKIFDSLKSNGGNWMHNLIKVLYPEPKYISNDAEAQKAYWQWDVNNYGNANSRPVCGESVLFTPTANYGSEISAAYQELRKAGLANERNNGYNEYWIYPTK